MDTTTAAAGPRVADERVGFFTTVYRDLGKFRDDEKWVRYINRWRLEKRDPDRRTLLPNPGNFAALVMNPTDNLDNLDPAYLRELEGMSEAMRRRFLLGQFLSMAESQLWTLELCDQQRIIDGAMPELVRIVVAVDPSGVRGEEDVRSDEIGIVVCGLGRDGRGYVLEDLSGRMSPEQWGAAAVSAYDRWEADAVIGRLYCPNCLGNHLLQDCPLKRGDHTTEVDVLLTQIASHPGPNCYCPACMRAAERLIVDAYITRLQVDAGLICQFCGDDHADTTCPQRRPLLAPRVCGNCGGQHSIQACPEVRAALFAA